MGVFGILDVDTIDSRITLRVALRQWWKDPRLTWDPALYGNMKTSRFPTDMESDNHIWTPDTTLFEIA